MAQLTIDIVTLFPGMFSGPFGESLVGKARAKGLVDIRLTDLRDYAEDKHRQVDDRQFGGGAGMLLKVEPIYKALKSLGVAAEEGSAGDGPFVVYLSPQGKRLTSDLARELAQKKRLIFLAGHYEGIDERAMRWIDLEVSLGDFVLTGGELPAMVLTDAVCRMVPGVVKEWESVENDSFFSADELDCSHYTRPAEFMGMKVPDVLLSGNHREIEAWRKASAEENTRKKRPDLAGKPKA